MRRKLREQQLKQELQICSLEELWSTSLGGEEAENTEAVL